MSIGVIKLAVAMILAIFGAISIEAFVNLWADVFASMVTVYAFSAILGSFFGGIAAFLIRE